jgi:hypothetical protein
MLRRAFRRVAPAIWIVLVSFFLSSASVQSQSPSDSTPETAEGAGPPAAESLSALETRSLELIAQIYGTEASRPSPSELAVQAFQMGKTYLAQGHFGAAVAWLTFANDLDPGDSELGVTLSSAKASFRTTLGTQGSSAMNSWRVTEVAQWLTEGGLALGLFLLAVSLFSIAWRLAGRLGSRIDSFTLRSVFHPLLALSSFLGLALTLWAGYFHSREMELLVAWKQVAVKSGPGLSFVTLGQVDAGALLPSAERRLGETENTTAGWHLVQYSESEHGWIPESAVLPLSNSSH